MDTCFLNSSLASQPGGQLGSYSNYASHAQPQIKPQDAVKSLQGRQGGPLSEKPRLHSSVEDFMLSDAQSRLEWHASSPSLPTQPVQRQQLQHLQPPPVQYQGARLSGPTDLLPSGEPFRLRNDAVQHLIQHSTAPLGFPNSDRAHIEGGSNKTSGDSSWFSMPEVTPQEIEQFRMSQQDFGEAPEEQVKTFIQGLKIQRMRQAQAMAEAGQQPPGQPEAMR